MKYDNGAIVRHNERPTNETFLVICSKDEPTQFVADGFAYLIKKMWSEDEPFSVFEEDIYQ